MSKNTILCLGVTGQIGRLTADRLKEMKADLRVCSRREAELTRLKEQYGSAVYLDLNDPRTYATALAGVDSLFMLTGYTVDMLVQSKALVDAAKQAGVKHIVHLGVFSQDPYNYDPHFAWHQLVEAYIKVSGINYTFLHPNCFMENLSGFYSWAREGVITFWADGKSVGWIAADDIAEAAAITLSEGEKHYGKDYWLSTESASMAQFAQIITEVTGEKFVANDKKADQFLKDMNIDRKSVDAYFLGVEESFIQIADGRMSYIADVRDDMPLLSGRKGIGIRDWVTANKEKLVALAQKDFD